MLLNTNGGGDPLLNNPYNMGNATGAPGLDLTSSAADRATAASPVANLVSQAGKKKKKTPIQSLGGVLMQGTKEITDLPLQGISELFTGKPYHEFSGDSFGGGKSDPGASSSQQALTGASLLPSSLPSGLTAAQGFNYQGFLDAVKKSPTDPSWNVTVPKAGGGTTTLSPSTITNADQASQWLNAYLTGHNQATPSWESNPASGAMDAVNPQVIEAYFKDFAGPAFQQAYTAGNNAISAYNKQATSDLNQIPAQFRGSFQATQDQINLDNSKMGQALEASQAAGPIVNLLQQLFSQNTAAKQALQAGIARYATGSTINAVDPQTYGSLANQGLAPIVAQALANAASSGSSIYPQGINPMGQ